MHFRFYINDALPSVTVKLRFLYKRMGHALGDAILERNKLARCKLHTLDGNKLIYVLHNIISYVEEYYKQHCWQYNALSGYYYRFTDFVHHLGKISKKN